MAHFRKDLRDAVKAALVASGIANGNVGGRRAYHYNTSQLPAVEVSTPEHESALEAPFMRYPVMTSEVDLVVTIVASAGDDIEDVLDDLATRAHSAIIGSASVQSVVSRLVPTGESFDGGDGQEEQPATRELRYTATIRHPLNTTDTAL